jgi:uncharacterized ParB-like nuclease family protein
MLRSHPISIVFARDRVNLAYAATAAVLACAIMMKRESFPIANIYVPIARRAMLDPKTVDELAENILQNGQKDPILVRRDGERFVLIEGLHRLEACRKLGETTIFGFLVQARRH